MLDRLVFDHDGRTFRCRVESPGVSAVPPAVIVNAQWTVEVDGVTRAAFEAHHDDTRDSVRRRVIDWYKDQQP